MVTIPQHVADDPASFAGLVAAAEKQAMQLATRCAIGDLPETAASAANREMSKSLESALVDLIVASG